jgi:hypothetical protein
MHGPQVRPRPRLIDCAVIGVVGEGRTPEGRNAVRKEPLHQLLPLVANGCVSTVHAGPRFFNMQDGPLTSDFAQEYLGLTSITRISKEKEY